MRIYFYPECNFNINKASVYDCSSLAEWFDSRHVNPDDYEIVGKDGEYHDSGYIGEVCAVYPKIMGGKKNGKNILTAVIGLALILTGGGALAHALHITGTMAKTLGAGLLLSGGGALLMGKMKMPSMDLSSESSTKQSYQWNVGNLSTSRGVKGVTFGSNVIPEGELLAYKTYGTSSLEEKTHTETSGHWENYLTPNGKLKQKWVTTTKEVHDGLFNTDDSSYLELLIGAGEGELDSITDIKINDIPLADLGMVENTDYAIRLGSNTQTALKQTNLDSQAGYSSIGQTVPVKLNNSVTPLLITTPSACDSCCIAFQAPNWYLYDTSSGAKNNAYIKLKIGYRVSGSSGNYTYLTKTISEIDNKYPVKSESAFYFQVVVKFPSNGTYQIRIENDSAELNYTKGLLSQAEYQGSSLPDRAALNITCDNIACYNNKEQTYPNTALIWLRIPASQTLNGSMPKVTWKQTRANIYAYNGSSYITKPANNLAWAIYDILAQVRKDGNTYHNEGEDVANIDYDKFAAFATFCESIGAMGNWFLNKLDTSWSNAMSVATSCRAFIGLRSGKVCPYWDAPTEMTQIFTVGNYENMSGVITAKKDRAKAIEATFNNEEEKYASRTVRVEIDNDHSAEAVSMTFAGLSDPVNVSKQAHYILRRNKYLVQSIKFTADIDSIVCELNDVIGIQCDLTEYGVGGRIFKVENNVISLDAPVTLTSGNTYALLVRHTDGTLERNTPVETNGTYTQLTFSSAWSKPVLKSDVYSFGIANSEVRKYRVTGITRTNDLKAQIEAIEYNENVYDELAVAPYTYTNPNAGINSIADPVYNPESVELAWDANNNTSYVNVYVDGVFYGRFKNGATIPNINSQQQIELVPVNEYGEEDAAIVRTISNNLPTPSIPPVPVVQSTSTGVVAEFSGIPKDENIVWLIIKESENELGRVNILGEYMSVSIQLRSGTHTLSAYFVNQFSKSSQARTFTATPLGDIVANQISATALNMPTGSILRLSAKNLTTASITGSEKLKDVSGRGNNATAVNLAVDFDAEMGDVFSFDGTGNYISFPTAKINALLDGKGITLTTRVKTTKTTSYLFYVSKNNAHAASLYIANSKLYIAARTSTSDNITRANGTSNVDDGEVHRLTGVFDFQNGKVKIYVDGVLEKTANLESSGTWDKADSYIFSYSTSEYSFEGVMNDSRIYARALSDTEVKSLSMFNDESVFAQLTADLIGANIIKGFNLFSENIITSTAQIANAIITDAKISGLIEANHIRVSDIVIGDLNGYNSMITSVNSTAQGYATDAANAVPNYVYLTSANSNTLAVVQGYGTDNASHSFTLAATEVTKCKVGDTVAIKYGVTDNSVVTYLYVVGVVTAKNSTTKITITSTGIINPFSGTQTVTAQTKADTADTTAQGIINDLVTGSTQYVAKIQGGMIVNGTLGIGKLETATQTKINDAYSTANTANGTANGAAATLAAWCYNNNLSFIDGGNIYAGTVTAIQMAANSITAEKIAVMGIPLNPVIKLNIQGLNSHDANTPIPDLSGYDNGFKIKGTWTQIYKSNTSGWSLRGTNANEKFINNVKEISMPASGWTFFMKFFAHSSGSGEQILFDCRPSGGGNTNRIQIRFDYGNNRFRIISYNSSATQESQYVSMQIDSTTWYDLVVQATSSTSITIYLTQIGNASDLDTKKVTVALSNARSDLSVAVGYFMIGGVSGNSSNAIYGYIGDIIYYTRILSLDEIKYLVKNAANNEAGLITADRISTDAIKSRNYAYSSGLYSTAGTFLDLANGQIISKNFSIDSSGNVSFKGAVEASSGKIGPLTIDNSYGFSNLTAGTYGKNGINIFYNSIESYQSGRDYNNGFILGYGKIASYDLGKKFAFGDCLDPTTANPLCLIGEYYNNQVSPRTDYTFPILKIEPYQTTHYGLYIEGKARIQSGEVTSDESVKKDFQDVSTLDKLKKLRICAWRFDEEKLVEKENDWIDKENIKIEAENKAIDAENAEIEKENELRKSRKDGEPVELLPLKERKKLRKHRIADKKTNHPLNIGCMAGEFNKAFGTNDGSEEALNITDTIGVCMRAIQELAAEVDSLKALLKTEETKEEQKTDEK